MINISLTRILSISTKEFIKITRDLGTLSIIIILPIVQIIIFGYAIDVFPKHLPMAVINYDNGPFTRRLIQGISTLSYFNVNQFPDTELKGERLLREGKVNFVLNIPAHFTQDLVRGNQPHVLLQVDGSVPGGTGNAIFALQNLVPVIFSRQFAGSLNYLNSPEQSPFIVDIQTNYNSDLKAVNAIVPGLIGVVLTLSLISLTCVTISEERESGTLEALLNSQIRPVEIMIGKFLSYLIIGYILLLLTVFMATKLLFNVPMEGSVITLCVASFPFIVASLMTGLAISTISRSQVASQQYSAFFFLPCILLSGFIFPFYGMPFWARALGNALPLTHYIRITSGIMLKGYAWSNIFPELWPIILFFFTMLGIAVLAFKQTMD